MKEPWASRRRNRPDAIILRQFKGFYSLKYDKAKKSEIVTLCGNHLSDKQLRKFIDELKAKGMLKTEGERGQMVYMIGDAYKESNEIMNKALKIGLNELLNREKGKGE